jgi:predicted nuclease of predicted toxin-antitoxin system
VKFKLDENLPVSAVDALTGCGHDADTVIAEGLTGAADPRVVAAAAAEGRVLITLDRGMGDIRAYPPGSHAGIVVLRLAEQSAPAVSEVITELANWADLDALAGAVAVLQQGVLRIRRA